MLTIRLNSLSRWLIGFCILITFLVSTYTFYTGTASVKLPEFQISNVFQSCSPQDYSAGEWVHSPHTTKTNMTKPEDSLEFSGFSGCASSREVWWHLAADNVNHWERFPAAQSWAWTPGAKCRGLRPLDPKELLKDLVEDGGWYLVGGKSTVASFHDPVFLTHIFPW